MRIIGGKYGSQRLAHVRGGIRPTSDRLRETLFDVVADSVRGSVWLDAFAGSGAVGIEALSRDARYVIFNDTGAEAIRLLRKNLKLCGVEEGYEVRQQDVFAFFRTPKSPPLDFIFLDPPYGFGRYAKLLRTVSETPSLQSRTLIVLEVFKKIPLNFVPENLTVSRVVRAGDNQLVFIVSREDFGNRP